MYNVLVFFVVGNIFYWSIPTLVAVPKIVRAVKTWISDARSSDAPDQAWLRTHIRETGALRTVYRSYVEWRQSATNGETINVEGPYLQRRTVNERTSGEKKAYFFGGSTMWGVGADDARTIPSQFAALTGIHSENFGELSYTAHQGLLLLIQLLQNGHRPDLVVFYDGVNDALHKCRNELGADSHERESQFRFVMQNSARPDSFSYYFAPILNLAQKVNLELSRAARQDQYDCPRNPAKAEAISDHLVSDWRFAKQLVEMHGGTFIGLLQPVIYFSQTRVEGVPLPKEFGDQYRLIYPMVRKKIAGIPGLYDITSVLDVDEAIYIDFCHLTPAGNRYVAQRVAEIVAARGGIR
jgi:lysophospholipase L1-like esterase